MHVMVLHIYYYVMVYADIAYFVTLTWNSNPCDDCRIINFLLPLRISRRRALRWGGLIIKSSCSLWQSSWIQPSTRRWESVILLILAMYGQYDIGPLFQLCSHVYIIFICTYSRIQVCTSFSSSVELSTALPHRRQQWPSFSLPSR